MYIRSQCNFVPFYSNHVHFEYMADLNVGDPITNGQFLGVMGRTGNATYWHEHYEFRRDGGALPVGMVYPFIPVTIERGCHYPGCGPTFIPPH